MNAELIDDLLTRMERVSAAVQADFGSLSGEELNWKTGAESWSIGQCLDHVMRSNDPYFAKFESASQGTYRHRLRERVPVLPGLWGNFVLNIVSPQGKRTVKAPKLTTPAQSAMPADIVESFLLQQKKLAAAYQSLADVDVDRIIVTSPLAPFVTYSMRHAMLILVAHEERHLQQMQRVRASMLEMKKAG